MKFLPLIGKALKDDEVIEILESFAVEVVYDFDRLHEGTADVYWATSKPQGFQFKFDEAQSLSSIFLYLKPADGFNAVSPDNFDVPFFPKKKFAVAFGKAEQLQMAEGRVELDGIMREWVRHLYATHSIHYEFQKDSLALVTISRNEQPAAIQGSN
ncbi:hypothetical protein GC207_12690 [bacterium]|nr:hypothetical protein [bacterium]